MYIIHQLDAQTVLIGQLKCSSCENIILILLLSLACEEQLGNKLG